MPPLGVQHPVLGNGQAYSKGRAISGECVFRGRNSGLDRKREGEERKSDVEESLLVSEESQTRFSDV